jgi:hypothetical protein
VRDCAAVKYEPYAIQNIEEAKRQTYMQIKRKLLNFTLQIISYGVVLVEPPELIDITPESGNELI